MNEMYIMLEDILSEVWPKPFQFSAEQVGFFQAQNTSVKTTAS